jgi:iron complex transport system substrate-binding protein
MRIVSLIPNATEIVCELGLIDQLVGVSHDCDWPPEIADVPILSDALVNPEYSSEEIDQIVRESLHNGISVYHIDPDLLKELQPDLILTQELCEVCAPSFDDVQQAARILDAEPQIISLEPRSVEEILENIELVGQVASVETFAREMVSGLRDRIDHIVTKTADVEDRPRLLCLEWLSPLFIGGHWIPEMVEMAGGETLGEPQDQSAEISWDDVEQFDPEIIVLMPCGFSPDRTADEMHLLTEQDCWDELRAVKNEQVYIAHGSYYFNRPGPRVVIGLEILAAILHPELFADMELPEGAFYRWASE